MNCKEFENHITEYTDGNLKKGIRKGFINHKDKCLVCKEKLNDIMLIIKEMRNHTQMKTSEDFLSKLNDRIHSYEDSFRLKFNRFVGFDYITTVGLAASFILVLGASYLLLTKEIN